MDQGDPELAAEVACALARAVLAAEGDAERLREIPLGNTVKRLGVRQVKHYPPLGLRGRMVMSYLGSVFDRSSRASTGRISALVTLSAPEAAGASVNSAGSQTSRNLTGAACVNRSLAIPARNQPLPTRLGAGPGP